MLRMQQRAIQNQNPPIILAWLHCVCVCVGRLLCYILLKAKRVNKVIYIESPLLVALLVSQSVSQSEKLAFWMVGTYGFLR